MYFAIETRLEESGSGWPILLTYVGQDFELAMAQLGQAIEAPDRQQLDPMTRQTYHLMCSRTIFPWEWVECPVP